MPNEDKTNQRLTPRQDPRLRRPPRAGGPRRKVAARPHRRPKSRLRKALPYLIASGSIGGSIMGTLSLSNLFSS